MDTDSAIQFLLPFQGARTAVSAPPISSKPIVDSMAQEIQRVRDLQEWHLRLWYIRYLSEGYPLAEVALSNQKDIKSVRHSLYEAGRLLGAPSQPTFESQLIDELVCLLVAAYRQAFSLPAPAYCADPLHSVDRAHSGAVIKDRIRALVLKLDLSTKELAKRCGIKHEKVQQILGGQSVPSSVDMLVLSAVLGVTVNELYGLTE